MGWEALVDFGAQTASEIHVSPERALRCVPVYAGVRVRCDVLSSLPLHLYERRNDGGKDRATEHPLYRLLHNRPNAWTSASEFIGQLEKDVICFGGGYALANRSGDRVVELIRIAPGSVSVEHDEQTLEPVYKVTLRNGRQQTYDWRDILHVPALDGLAAIRQAREAIGLCIAMESHAARLFGGGARPSGLLKTKGKLSEARFDSLRKSWNASHSGASSGKTAILEDGTEFQPLSFSSVDLQFNEMRAWQVAEIARALGVPPTLLFDYGRATWANAEEQALSFLTFTILPRLQAWQGAISRLLSPEEQCTFYPEFLVDSITKAEVAARYTAYAQAISSGILSPNEIRAKENLPPYEGGDQYRLPLNTESASENDNKSVRKVAA
jgi:HK97 family phage portal protein